MGISDKIGVIVGYDKGDITGERVRGASVARLFKRILLQSGFENSDINMLTSGKATKKNVINALEWLRSVEKPESEVVIFFGGSGSRSALALADGGITHRQIRDLAPVKSQKQLIVIDSCGSAGAIFEGYDGVTLRAPNRIVVTSTSSEFESSTVKGKYTSWAWVFLHRAILLGEADFDGDGYVSIQDADAFSDNGLIADDYFEPFIL